MISLDVFDTAIIRDVYLPTDIFKLVEDKVGKNFYNKRIEAERKARENNKHYNLAQIYCNIPEFKMHEEIEMEMKHCKANPAILEFYNNTKEQVVFISDMYLPSYVIEQLLEKCGYKDPLVYVSCELNENKGSGVAFKKVEYMRGEKITKHIGDNYLSDVLGARKVGIEGRLIPALHNKDIKLPIIKNPMLKKYLAEVENSKDESIVKMAKWHAPLIYAFTNWVLSNRKEGQSIYFLSRDMGMPFQIARDVYNANDIYYLHASRRSTSPIALTSINDNLREKMTHLLTQEEMNAKIKEGPEYIIKYFKNMGIKNNDIIVDIGYSGSTQYIIEQALNIKLNGYYMQTIKDPKWEYPLLMNRYLNRDVIRYQFLTEFMITSPEDNVESYDRSGNPIFTPDNDTRKQYAKKIYQTVLSKEVITAMSNISLDLFDIEQIMIHIAQYTPDYMLPIFNEKILTNRKGGLESGINYDKESILNGNLIDNYNMSYARPLYIKMLQSDKDLSHLARLLQQ